MSIAQPRNLQLQSSLISLPAEIKDIIYSYCFVSDRPIVDPGVSGSPTPVKRIPTLGIHLLLACRRVYHEADHRPLVARNRFHFSTIDRARCFLQSLSKELGASVRDIEIDARRMRADQSANGLEWLQYISCGGGAWLGILDFVPKDAPGLECLRLNLDPWPRIPLFGADLWSLLRSVLLQVSGLEKLVVIGGNIGGGVEDREPWSRAHFVGGHDVVSDDLIEHMCGSVKGENRSKIIRWGGWEQKARTRGGHYDLPTQGG